MSFFSSGFLDPDSHDPQYLSLKSGVDYSKESDADKLLAKSREGVTALKDKRDWFTFDQMRLRTQKEVLNANGISDESLMSGLFKRTYNPLFGQRPGRGHHSDD